MDNKINSAVSFQAKLVTPIKGRNNIMKPVAERFAEITKNIPGELKFEREPFAGASEHLFSLEYNGASYVTRQVHDVLSLDPAKLSKKGITVLAQKFVDCLKALKIEVEYKQKVKPIDKEIFEYRRSINRTKLLKYTAAEYNLDGMVENYQSKINKINQKIEKLNLKKAHIQDLAEKKMSRYREKDLGLDMYTDVFGYDIRH